MKINYEWLKLDSYDEVILAKYCTTNAEVEFCLWVSGDFFGDIESFIEIVNLIEVAKKEKQSFEWHGDTCVLEIDFREVTIFHPLFQSRTRFVSDEFLNEFFSWKNAQTKLLGRNLKLLEDM